MCLWKHLYAHPHLTHKSFECVCPFHKSLGHKQLLSPSTQTPLSVGLVGFTGVWRNNKISLAQWPHTSLALSPSPLPAFKSWNAAVSASILPQVNDFHGYSVQQTNIGMKGVFKIFDKCSVSFLLAAFRAAQTIWMLIHLIKISKLGFCFEFQTELHASHHIPAHTTHQATVPTEPQSSLDRKSVV